MSLSSSQKYRLENQQQDLLEWLKATPDADLKKEWIEGKWSMWQNAVHIFSYQLIFLKRMKKILAEEIPSFERFVPDNDKYFLEYEKFDKKTLIEKGIENREEINQFLISLDETQLQRSSLHQQFGNNNIETWTEFFLLHEAHHLFTFFKLKRMSLKTIAVVK
jgi:uncharacterized damage-inducible protein DinB